MPIFTTKCVVLKKIKYGEADSILTLFTKHKGKILAIAKGVRKVKSRKAGNLDLFDYSKVTLAEGKSLHVITYAEVINSYKNIKRSLETSSWLYFLGEILDKLLPEDQEQSAAFRSVVKGLADLDRSPTKEGMLGLVVKILEGLGYWSPSKRRQAVGSNFELYLRNYLQQITERNLNSIKFMDEVKTLT